MSFINKHCNCTSICIVIITSSTNVSLSNKCSQMIKFITSLGNSLGVHKEELGPDLDPLMEAILFRSRQLYRNEGSLVADQKTQIYSLQRKIKSLNEVLTSKVRSNNVFKSR